MDDHQIIELYFCRSEYAIQETDRKYGRYCHNIAYNILSSQQDAEECVNDTYLTAWNRIPPTKPGCFSVFIGTITRNLSIDRWRKKQAVKRGKGQLPLALDELEHMISSQQDLEEDIIRSELTECINDFLRTLPQTERRVFICRYWYLDSIGDICKQFGITQGKAKSMLLRTRNKLKKHLIMKGALDA